MLSIYVEKNHDFYQPWCQYWKLETNLIDSDPCGVWKKLVNFGLLTKKVTNADVDPLLVDKARSVNANAFEFRPRDFATRGI